MKFTALILFSLFTSACVAEEPAPVKEVKIEQLKAEGFVPIFNGKDLDGWEVKVGEGKYSVADGCIVGTGKFLPKNSFLCTKQTYRDFIFVFEMKFDSHEGNSGCMFRALWNDSEKFVYGYQCEHDNKERNWTAGLFDESRRGWLFPKKEDLPHGQAFTEQGKRLFKTNDWNLIVVKCQGPHIQTWMNGELRVDYTDKDPKHSTPEGFFGLQVHGGPACDVRWRNLYVKAL